MTRQHQRTQERRNALQVLYQSEILETSPSDIIAGEQLADETQYMGDYARMLLDGVKENMDVLDSYLMKASENWALDRMPAVDRSLLRLSAYEMKYVDDVPISVSINEAVNLAKLFGGDDSPRFINGILGRIAIALEEECGKSADAPSAPEGEASSQPIGVSDEGQHGEEASDQSASSADEATPEPALSDEEAASVDER